MAPIGNPITLTENVAAKIINVVATDAQTQFTVQGGYRINQLGVYRNGVRLVGSYDFTATDGSLVDLKSPCEAGDYVQFQIFDDFAVADAILKNNTDQTIQGNLTVTGTLDVQTGASTATAFIGISSGGTKIGAGKTLNFIGSGNTFAQTGDTIDISISGSGGGGLGTAINYADGETATPFSYIGNSVKVTENLAINTSNAGGNTSYVVTVIPNVEISSGVAVTVGTGKTMIIDVLKIGDL